MSEGGGDIVIKKVSKGGHGGHHGGAWKIAYADFVTAMMAFFLLLWLLSSVPQDKLKAISEYFMPTIGLKDQKGIGFQGGAVNSVTDGVKSKDSSSPSIVMGAPSAGAVVQLPDGAQTEKELDVKNFTSVKNDLYKAIHDNPELKEFSENVLISQTPEGLRIQILDDDKKSMFKPGTAIMLEHTKKILDIVAKYIKYLPNYISIDGHTNTSATGENDEDWTLSILRAETTRRYLVDGKIDKEQVYRVVGKGDQEPMDKAHPSSPANMRISMVLLKNSLVPYEKRSLPKTFGIE